MRSRDRFASAIGGDAAVSSPVSTRLTDIPERAGGETARADDAKRRPASPGGWLASTKSTSAGSAKTTVPFVPTARASASAANPSSAARRPDREVRADDEERGDHQVVESGRSLEHDHGEGRERQRPERSRAPTHPRRRAIPTIATHAASDREQLNEADEAVALAQDHRHRRLDLRARRKHVDPLVRGVRDVADGMLLLPERCPRQVVEHRVREALRYGERDDEEVCVGGGRERGEERHRTIAERFARGSACQRGGAGRPSRSHRARASANSRRRPAGATSASARRRGRARARRPRSRRSRRRRRRAGSRRRPKAEAAAPSTAVAATSRTPQRGSACPRRPG